MQTSELATMFRNMGQYANSKVKPDFEALADLLEEVPADSAKVLCQQLRRLISTQRDSVPSLLARIRKRSGGPEDSSSLRTSIQSLKSAALKTLARALGVSTKGRKDDVLRNVLNAIVNGENAVSDQPTDQSGKERAQAESMGSDRPSPSQVNELVACYKALASDAKHLDYAEIDRRFARIEEQTGDMVKALAVQLGYPPASTKSAALDALRRPLRKIREAENRTRVI